MCAYDINLKKLRVMSPQATLILEPRLCTLSFISACRYLWYIQIHRIVLFCVFVTCISDLVVMEGLSLQQL